MKYIGKSINRIDALNKVTGKAKYVDDYFFPDMLYVSVVRSEIPFGRIKSIDTSRALKLNGIVGIFKAQDIPGSNRYGFPIPDNQILCYDKVRYIGDAICIIAGESKNITEQAKKLVKVEYEEKEPILTSEQALDKNAEFIHSQGNIYESYVIKKGRFPVRHKIPQKITKMSQSVDMTFHTDRVEHAYIEPEGAVSRWNGNKLVVYFPHQSPYVAKRIVQNNMDLPEDRVQIIQTEVGGSFGGKDDVAYEAACFVALVTIKTGMPAKYIASREESIISSYKRHPFHSHYQLKADKNGKLQGIKMDIISDGGAYAGVGPFVLWRNIIHSAGPYIYPSVDLKAKMVYTNNVYCGAFRGFGNPQANFAHESIIDEMADKLNIDPIELRLKNVLKKGAETATKHKLDIPVALTEILHKLKAQSNWTEKRNEYRKFNKHSDIKKGIGVALMYHGVSLGAEGRDFAQTTVDYIPEKQKILVTSGITELGQGTRTSFWQIAAESLQINKKNIMINNYDTDLILDSGPTVASRGVTLGGMAILKAISNFIYNLKVLIKKHYSKDVQYKNGYFLGDNFCKSLFEICKVLSENKYNLLQTGIQNAKPINWNKNTGLGIPYLSYHFAGHIADLEVDTKTGMVILNDYYAIHDVGKAVNPQQVKAQIYGGIMQGLGYALLEKLEMNKARIMSTNFDTYLIPTVYNKPKFHIEILEHKDNIGPYGAKGTGEPPLVPVAAAVCNAIKFAIGKRITSLPADLEMILLGKHLSKYNAD